jgi:hypothetical protein
MPGEQRARVALHGSPERGRNSSAMARAGRARRPPRGLHLGDDLQRRPVDDAGDDELQSETN